MSDAPLFEITVTGIRDGEWQGLVYFPAAGERETFRSLLELVRIVVERGGAPMDLE